MRASNRIPDRITTVEAHIAGIVGTYDYDTICQETNNPRAKTLMAVYIAYGIPNSEFPPTVKVIQYFTDGERWFEEVCGRLMGSMVQPHIRGFVKQAIAACVSGEGQYFKLTSRGPKPTKEISTPLWASIGPDPRVIPVGEKDGGQSKV